jgi:hypothetical protein
LAHSIFDKYLSPKAVDVVIRYNFNTDFYAAVGWKALQYKILPFYPVARRWYKNTDHFDEMNESADIVANWRHHYGLIMEVIDDTKYPLDKIQKIWRILGRSSHAMSDITAHSNLVLLLFDYFRDEAGARKVWEASGKTVEDFISAEGPTLGNIINEPKYADFREKYFPKYFAYQSIRDVGPRSHSECNMDRPMSPMCVSNPKIFKVALDLARREACDVFDTFFEKLKIENPAKFKLLTEAYRDDSLPFGEYGKFAGRARWWAQKVGGWD